MDQSRETGLASTELVVLFPFLLLLTFVPIQFALYWHARQVATHVAAEVLDEAVVLGASELELIQLADQILVQTSQLDEVDVEVDLSDAESIEVIVTAKPRYEILPLGWSIEVLAVAEQERFVGEGDR